MKRTVQNGPKEEKIQRRNPDDNYLCLESAQGLPPMQILHEGHLGEVTKGCGSDHTKLLSGDSAVPKNIPGKTAVYHHIIQMAR